MTSEILIVDLASSQEDADHVVRGSEKRKEVVTIVGNEPKKPRLCTNSSLKISKMDIERLEQRLNLVENLVTREANSQTKNEPTRDEFNKLERRVTRLEERVNTIEQALRTVQNVFQSISIPEPPVPNEAEKSTKGSELVDGQVTGQTNISPAGGNSVQATRSSTRHAGQSNENPPITQRKAEKVPKEKSPNPATSKAQNYSVTASTSSSLPIPPNSSTASPKPTARNAPTASPVINNNLIIRQLSGPSANQTLGINTSSLTITPVTTRNSTSISPLNATRTPSGTPKKTFVHQNQSAATPSGSVVRDKPSASTQLQHTSNDIAANLAQILSVTPNQNENEEVSDQMLLNIPIKKELFAETYAPERRKSELLLKDDEDRYLVYVFGDAKKVRNKDLYYVRFGWSLNTKRTQIVPYQSDIQTVTAKKQAEIMASYFAVEDLKRNSGESGPLRITIVTHCKKLITTMTEIQNIYVQKDVCNCSQYPCGHQGRWYTLDAFASTFHDDIPRLVLATRNIDVKWRTYQLQDAGEESRLKLQLKQYGK